MRLNQFLVAAVATIAASQAVMAEDSFSAPPAPTSTLTRAEVLADLQIYRESGLAELNRGDSADITSVAHAAAQAKYAQLRTSPYYATLVQRIAAQRGERQILAEAAR